MKKISEKSFIRVMGIIAGILAVSASFLVKYEVIQQLYEFPILLTIFSICVLITAIMDKAYFKNYWSKKQSVGMITFSVMIVIATVLAWIFK